MAEARLHHDQHLGPIYEWMVGPFATACRPAVAVFEELGLEPGRSGIAVDLGCGHGLQALPLAQRGFNVLAVDTCAELLDRLSSRRDGLPIETIQADLVDTQKFLPEQIDVAVCMGETLTHLRTLDEVEGWIGRIATALAPGGTLVTSFRDYCSSPLSGDQRFIPVRSDENRVLTCFLEYGESSLRVHDLLYERTDAGWEMTVSSYPTLRLDPAWVVGVAERCGLRIVFDRTERGRVVFAARSADAS